MSKEEKDGEFSPIVQANLNTLKHIEKQLMQEIPYEADIEDILLEYATIMIQDKISCDNQLSPVMITMLEKSRLKEILDASVKYGLSTASGQKEMFKNDSQEYGLNVMPLDSTKPKREMLFQIFRSLAGTAANFCIYASEAYMASYTKEATDEDKEIMQKVAKGEISVKDAPNQKEILLISTERKLNGKILSKTLMYNIIKDEDGSVIETVLFDPEKQIENPKISDFKWKEMDENTVGNFTNLLKGAADYDKQFTEYLLKESNASESATKSILNILKDDE